MFRSTHRILKCSGHADRPPAGTSTGDGGIKISTERVRYETVSRGAELARQRWQSYRCFCTAVQGNKTLHHPIDAQ